MLAAGCGDGTGSGSTHPTTTTTTSSTTTSPAPTATSAVCFGAKVWGEKTTTLTAPGISLAGAVVGSGPNAAVFLHQSDQSYCGFWPYVSALPAGSLHGYLFGLCGFGDSTCSTEATVDRRAQIALLVSSARKAGAKRVTLVGASMGGALAVGYAKAVGADAVVDLSGPPAWFEAPTSAAAAPTLTMPLLVVLGAPDSSQRERLEAMVAAAPTQHKAFRWVPDGGHGWDQLTTGTGEVSEVGREVLEMVQGSGPRP